MQQSEGNPYILSELITHARESGLLHADGTVNLNALSSAPIVPPGIYNLIQARLARLSDPARRILDAAVAMGAQHESGSLSPGKYTDIVAVRGSVLLRPASVFDGVSDRAHDGWVVLVAGKTIVPAGPARRRRPRRDLGDARRRPPVVAREHVELRRRDRLPRGVRPRGPRPRAVRRDDPGRRPHLRRRG